MSVIRRFITYYHPLSQNTALRYALYAIRMFAQYYVTSWGHIMGAHMETDMRSQLFAHFEKLSFSYYDKNNTGHMMSRMISSDREWPG